MQRILEPEVMDTLDEAQGYDAMDHSEPNNNFVQRLVELGAAGRMLDIGTGPGHIPLLVCARIAGATVTAVDLSQHMLEIARRKAAASPWAGRIEFRLADAKGLPFPDGAFDTVFSNTILHHIPDPRPFLREARRVLKSGGGKEGTLLIRDLFRPDSNKRVEELVRLHTEGANEYQKQLFRQSLQASLTPEELRNVAAESGLTARDGFAVVVDTNRHMSLQRRAR
jgi:ubiquinone/menaquinone biosynthesis C-methylase UbiE